MKRSDGYDDLPVVVAITASAGGVRAISEILAALPRDFPGAVLVVMHLTAAARGLLPQLLGARAWLHVVEATGGEVPRAGWVYTAPPNRHLVVDAQGALCLSRSAVVHHVRPAADPLFQSVAERCGPRSIAVVLTGRDGDGAEGVCAIKAAGGTVIAQDPDTAECGDMPRHAVETGAVDLVLPLSDIARHLVQLANQLS